MAANPQKIALYCQNTFDVANPSPSQITQMIDAANDLSQSGFGTILLGQWHVHSDGSIYYNDSPLDSVIQALKVIPTALKQGGFVKKVLISFGPFASDFQAIKDHYLTFQRTMAGVLAVTDIDGFDWDLEQNYSNFTDLIVDLTQWTNGLGKMVTAAPYEEVSFWKSVYQRTNTGGDKGFAWWNLQTYSGITDYGTWVDELRGLVPDPESFLVPGFKVLNGATPSVVSSTLAQWQQSYPQLDGGFIWQYEDLVKSGHTARQYAEAIAQGLGGVSQSEEVAQKNGKY